MRWTWILILGLAGCRELAQDSFEDYPQVPIVNAMMEAGKPIELVIALTGKIDTTSLERITDAQIELFEKDEPIETLFFVDSVERYQSLTVIKAGQEYTLNVSLDGFDPISVSQTVPCPTPIISLGHIDVAGKNEEGIACPAVQIEFANDPNKQLYYEILLRLVEGDHETYAIQEIIDDPILLNEGLPLILFSNEHIERDRYDMRINYSTGSYQSVNGLAFQMVYYPLIVELRTVSEDYYRYGRQHYLYNLGRYPSIIGGVVTNFNLHSNVQGGTGIVSSLSTFQSDTLYPASYLTN